MTWQQPRALMDTKREFVEMALKEGANRRELCRRYGISPKTGYALLKRHGAEGMACCQARSTKPHTSPTRTWAPVEQAVMQLRQAHPAWGGRKIAQRLMDLGHSQVPAPSTITSILHRHGLISLQASEAARHWQRFEHDTPNALWQIDFKGHFDTPAGRCHPLTLLDDHSRFNLVLSACARPDTPTVQQQLRQAFTQYDLPVRINADNGGPWGTPRSPADSLSELSVWLIRLGMRVSHSAPYHPQTNGKIERFHRSLKAEVLNGCSFAQWDAIEQAFLHWREIYNCQRPHQALDMATPVQRYCASPRPYPTALQPIEYDEGDTVITVGWNGFIEFQDIPLRLSSALHRLPVALRPAQDIDGVFDFFFCHQRFMRLDMTSLTTIH